MRNRKLRLLSSAAGLAYKSFAMVSRSQIIHVVAVLN